MIETQLHKDRHLGALSGLMNIHVNFPFLVFEGGEYVWTDG
jgi:hypothetical protein